MLSQSVRLPCASRSTPVYSESPGPRKDVVPPVGSTMTDAKGWFFQSMKKTAAVKAQLSVCCFQPISYWVFSWGGVYRPSAAS